MNARSAQMITLGLAGVLAWMGAGRGYGWLADAEAPPITGVGRIDGDAVAMPPESEFAEVRQRPIFNEDRKPTPIVEATVDPPVAPVPLNITLTGIVMTPDIKLAMLRDNAKNEAVSLRVGMPLPGDQQVWTLSEIRARSVVFKNPQDESSEVELEVAPGLTVPPSARAPAPPPPPAPGAPPAPPAGTPATGAPPSLPGQAPAPPDRAAELQRRIEERRREMREQAEKLRQQQEKTQ